MKALPQSLLARPIAHRAFHEKAAGRVENSASAFSAAIAAGYPVECDLQLSSDGAAMVFHDYALGRLTAESGPVRQHSAAQLGEMGLTGGDDAIWTLPEMLKLVAGRVPLLIELKDQDGILGPNVGALEEATVAALADYSGDVALMSFNPHSVAALATLAPDIPRGLTTCSFDPAHWATIPATRLAELATLPDVARTGASFISHRHTDLANPRVAALAAEGLPILCWTVRSRSEATTASTIAQNITFEGYAA